MDMELSNIVMDHSLKDISRKERNMVKESLRATMKNNSYGKMERKSQID